MATDVHWLSLAEAIGSIATALSVIVATIGVFWARRQILLAREQAETQFEDGLVREYREIARRLPVGALLGEELEGEEYTDALPNFYHYIDLSNEQVFLRQHGRVSAETWESWRGGIASNFRRPAFKKAWEEVKIRANDIFAELRHLEESGFKDDPIDWRETP